ncbi:DUF3429 domain-containing protein [Hydrogenophaga sp. IBVHS2]|uniref:DUF3429 domain-containing protein n=1 Tax=Hydrogenophaga sp. IBVHS2 TaxID=1985170 RepID=UPI000A2D701B|nr:DUF3429 domain-containing protein [Hydrogenophaga sp. IBVHS2]OSZ64702.1 DUF3429 domain-containing protein [Hydrogenophaga sp. IBVHS2]
MNAASPHTLSPTPDPARRLIDLLGYGGLLPFVGLALLLWLVTPDLAPWVAMALSAYAALIASFLGGIHWGVAWLRMERGQPGARTHLAWGVTPSLLAWPGVLMPAYAGLVWLAVVLVLCYLVDRRLYPAAGLSPWLALRFRLSAVAALSCLIGAGAT